jgi:hypothetical protein
LRNAQAISSADVAASVFFRQRVELLQHLDNRPIRDPLAVGQAATADHRGVDGSQSFHRQSGLAHAGIAGDGDQLAALLGLHALPYLVQERQLWLTADEQPSMEVLWRVVHSQ